MPKLKFISWRDVPDIVRAYRYLVGAGWKLFVRRESSDVWLARWSEAATASSPDSTAILAAKRAARWSNTAARYPFPWARCLQRSLALSMWMDAKELSPVLRIGVRKSPTGIDAHSWVEFNDEILNDSEFVGTTFSAFDIPARQGARKVSDLERDQS